MKKESFGKRLGKFLLSFIAPRKLEVHRDMNIFVAVMIFLVCMILCAGIPSVRLKSLVKNKYLNESYCYRDTYVAELQDFDLSQLPTFEMDDNKRASKISNNAYQEYHLTYKNGDELPINLTIVYDFDCTSDGTTKFDINSYLSVVPFDPATKQLTSRDILVIYTDQILYYVFNHGYNDSYAKSADDAVLEDYNYLHIANWVNTGKWSEFEGTYAEDGKFSLNLYFPTEEQALNNAPSTEWTAAFPAEYDQEGNLINNTRTINGTAYTGVKRYTNKINSIFTYGSQTNVGIYSYLQLESEKLAYNNLTNPLVDFSNIMVTTTVTNVRTYSYILSLFYVVLLPVMWVLIMWLILRKNGNITRLREFYSIGAAAMILPSIATAIVGLWIPYTIMARIAMIVQAVWYFIVCSAINTAPKKQPAVAEEVIDAEATVQTEATDAIETTPIAEVEVKEEPERPRPSRIE